ncbi:WxL domain-containing protein [Niallia sp. Krafla_26]|uniref:WxL domain-containing protein n=1 Tax=Niallia sp. Krafla_26 TaxID=3064703 RepID=UPI003D177931
MKQSIKKVFATVSTLAIMGTAFLGGQSAFAAESTIVGGSLSMPQEPTAGTFDAVTLNGLEQTTTATLGAFTVIDARGTGSGWKVMVQASQFTDSDKGLVLPEGSLNIALPTVTPKPGASEVLTITKASGKIDNSTGVKILSAAEEGGMGTYEVAANTLTLNLQPKDVKAGTYASTVKVTVTTGP